MFHWPEGDEIRPFSSLIATDSKPEKEEKQSQKLQRSEDKYIIKEKPSNEKPVKKDKNSQAIQISKDLFQYDIEQHREKWK